VEKVGFLAGLPAAQRQKLLSCAVRETFKKGAALFREDDPVDALFILHSGKVKLSAFDSDGREQIIGIFSGGDVIWEGMLTEESRYPYSGICLADVDLCRIRRQDFEQLVQDPMIALRVIGFLSQKLHDANARGRLLATSDPLSRLAGFLLNRSRHAASDTVNLRLEDIAASISLRPETVSRKLRELERMRLTRRVGQSGIRIMDADGVRAVFEGGS